MRSVLVTFLLLATAAILGVLSFWQMRDGSLYRLIGTPPTAIGEKIYPDFIPGEVTAITVKSGDTIVRFTKSKGGWNSTTPWQDRMDPRAAIAILTFANTAIAVDSTPRDKMDPARAGFKGASTTILMRDASGRKVAFFRLGRRTPLVHLTDGENPEQIPTTYLLPLDDNRKSHVYAATGDILPFFKDGFRFLRDHRPFYFNPFVLEKIRLRTDKGDLTLGRATPASPWRIVKPLDLPTDPAAVKTLLEGLVSLQASKVSDRAEATIPSADSTLKSSQIAFSSFGSETETVLDILPPASPADRETQATVSDRPGTLFTIPLRTEPDLVSISDLPLTVSELRDPTLTNLNIASIRGIAIQTATTPAILVSRTPPAPWTATVGGNEQPANEQRLYDLLKAATGTRALAFETDAAPEDLSPWGLDRPILTLTFLAGNNQTLAIAFGLDKSGNLFAKRRDTPTVMRLDNRFLDKIAVNPHDWRHARLWSLSKIDLTSLTRTDTGSPPLVLRYNDLAEKWQASLSGGDATASLDPSRANFLLRTLENLQVSRWLSPADPAAAAALASPALSFAITENTIDDLGEISGSRIRTLTLAPDPSTGTIFGKLDTDPSPFTLDPETYLKLNIPLLDE